MATGRLMTLTPIGLVRLNVGLIMVRRLVKPKRRLATKTPTRRMVGVTSKKYHRSIRKVVTHTVRECGLKSVARTILFRYLLYTRPPSRVDGPSVNN